MSSGGSDSRRKQNGSTPRNNRAQNKQTTDASRKYGLNKSQQEFLHDEVSHQGGGYKEALEAAREISQWRKGKNPWKQKRRRR